jgi:hypothetical protein
MTDDLRHWLRLVENTNGIVASVAKLPLDDQHRLAKILTADVYAWIIGDPMYSGENQSFVESFRYLTPFIPTKRKRSLRIIHRGVRVDEVPADWEDGSARQAITSLKPLQSWSAKISVAREFTDGNKQDWTKGRHGVIFTARASALPILFTMLDLRDCYLHLMEGLSYEAKDHYKFELNIHGARLN